MGELWRPPHALIFPLPAQGHITPMMQFARKLVSEGFFVSFLNTEHTHKKIIASAPNLPPNIRFLTIPDGLPDDHPRTGRVVELHDAIENLGDAFHKLVESLMAEHPPVSCIITDIYMSRFAQDVANAFHIPRVCFWTTSATAVACYANASKLMEKGYIGSKEVAVKPGPDDLVTVVPCLSSMRVKDLPYIPEWVGEDAFFERGIRNCSRLCEADWVIINTFYELEGSTLEGISQVFPIIPIGPLLPSLEGTEVGDHNRHATGLWSDEDDCLKWLDSQGPSSVLYISFGSVASFPAPCVKELALGLEASQVPFLWVMRSDITDPAIKDFMNEFMPRTKNRSCIISWAPQLLVLSHPSVGGFLTHNGWNSTLEGVCAGVPMICLPAFADQMTNCRNVVSVWKTGFELQRGDSGVIEQGEVKRVVKLLMEEPEGKEARERAAKLKDAARNAVMPGGSSYKNLDALLEDMRTKAQSRPI